MLLLLHFLKLKTLKTYKSPINGILEVKQTFNGQKKLFLNLATQGLGPFSKGVEKSYWYYMAQRTTWFCANKPNPKVLILGLGANTVSGIINKQNPEVELTLVELDPTIVQICKDFFDLNKLTNSTVLVKNAFEVIEEVRYQNYFDVVISDIITGEHTTNAPSCYNTDYVKKLAKLTKPHSLLLFNHPVHTKETRQLHEKFMSDLINLEMIDKTDKELFKYPFGFKNYTVSIFLK